MSHEGRDHHERVDLSDYECRQIEALERALSQDPPQTPDEDSEEKGRAKASSFRLTLLIASALAAAFGVAFGIVPLTIVSVLGVSFAVLLCCEYWCT